MSLLDDGAKAVGKTTNAIGNAVRGALLVGAIAAAVIAFGPVFAPIFGGTVLGTTYVGAMTTGMWSGVASAMGSIIGGTSWIPALTGALSSAIPWALGGAAVFGGASLVPSVKNLAKTQESSSSVAFERGIEGREPAISKSKEPYTAGNLGIDTQSGKGLVKRGNEAAGRTIA